MNSGIRSSNNSSSNNNNNSGGNGRSGSSFGAPHSSSLGTFLMENLFRLALFVLLCCGSGLVVFVSSSSSPTNNSRHHHHHHQHTNPISSSSSSSFVGELIEETGFYQSIRLTQEEPIFQKQSQYQFIEVRRSPYYGKILVLDGVVQLTERDADSYNEMMAHMAMFQHANPKRILVIGGGDGYVLSEVLKHDSVQHVDHVDLDEEVITTCQKYFPKLYKRDPWKDPRVTLHVQDGAAFVRNTPNHAYDVIIQDSSDPWTWGEDGEKLVLPSSVLYSQDHFSQLYRILSPNGILNIQAESLQIPSDLNGARDWRQLALKVGFEGARYGSIMISSYPTGQIGFLLCEKDAAAASTVVSIEERFAQITARNNGTTATSYYHPPLQQAAFILPRWAEQHIYSNEVESSPSCLQEEL